MLVVSWLWVASASGFWLCFLGLSCCANGCCSVFNGFCGGLLITVVVVVVLFLVFCLQWIVAATVVVVAVAAVVLWLLSIVLDILF